MPWWKQLYRWLWRWLFGGARRSDPADFIWSSYRTRLGLETNSWLDTDPCFLALAATQTERCKRYVKFVQQAVSPEEMSLIRDALQRGQLTGNSRFVDQVEKITGLRIERRGRGRPHTT